MIILFAFLQKYLLSYKISIKREDKMTYRLDKISIKVKDDKKGFEQINEIYEDIFKGKIPLIHNNKRKSDIDLIPLGHYENYSEDEYTFTVYADDFDTLLQIYKWINYGDIMEFKGSGSSIDQARKDARHKLAIYWGIERTFTNDFETIIPKYDSRDGKVHCSLFVGIKNKYENSD